MGDPRGFLKVERDKEHDRPVGERVLDWHETTEHAPAAKVREQASRCMDCGIPFCHQGCPLGNLIPEWNDLVYRGRVGEAAKRLAETNNFPEVTGRVCPAPCEASCVLNIRDEPVTIKTVERTIADAVFESPLVPMPAAVKTGKKVAVVGSGPAGMAAAQQLARAGHDVTLFERDDRIGGLLRYGIPDFKMEKGIIDRRMEQMRAEGVTFQAGVAVGEAVEGDQLTRDFDAVVLTTGSRVPRDLPIAGRGLKGVHFAMEFLVEQNKRIAGDAEPAASISAKGKHVIVIGGGDTGSDCVGTSFRQGALSVTQLELMPKPSLVRMPANPWPEWPLILRTSSSQEEGAERDWAVSTRSFREENGAVVAIDAHRIVFEGGKVKPIEGSDFALPAGLVLLAMGFVGPERPGVIEQLGLTLDARGNIRTEATGATNVPGVFAAGDASRGQSLVVWAIADGRRVAAGVDAYLRRAPMAKAV
ncbi:MAG TPA: glutamate synthase subunit beta [Polyangiaceae bacterium]|jgi:glutamate synthase (NADPH/NADH) small chain|nr:glutamate synthase subunit beta [Polyangiaceae bacterium]